MAINFKIELPEVYEKTASIMEYGAVSGGTVSNTKAINAAIQSVAEQGGGRVIVPSGIWLTGPITLLSNIDLHLESGALLLFDKNKEEYPLIINDYEGIKHIRAVSPIHAKDAVNICITGEGVIDGNGHLWRIAKEMKFTKRHWDAMIRTSPDTIVKGKECDLWFPTKSAYEGYMAGEPDVKDPDCLEKAAEHYDFYRPVMVDLVHCDRVLIEGVTLQNSPAWNVHPIFCTNVTIRDAFIKNPAYAQNGDGLDLESCRYAEIYNVRFDVGDDAICMKSGKNAEARKVEIPTQDVFIHDCTVYHGHGGFVVGSEMSRGVKNVWVENCLFMGTDVGIRFKSALGRGGVVEDIYISNVNMVDIENEAIIFTMGYELSTMNKNEAERKESTDPEDIPEFRNITIKNVVCTHAGQSLKVEGLPGYPIHDIMLRNVKIKADQEQSIVHGENICFEDCEIQ